MFLMDFSENYPSPEPARVARFIEPEIFKGRESVFSSCWLSPQFEVSADCAVGNRRSSAGRCEREKPGDTCSFVTAIQCEDKRRMAAIFDRRCDLGRNCEDGSARNAPRRTRPTLSPLLIPSSNSLSSTHRLS